MSGNAIDPGTRIVYDKNEEQGRGEAIVRDSDVDDWERWYVAEDVETGEELHIGESSVITTRVAETDGGVHSSSETEQGTVPDCTFCDNQSTATIAAKEVGREGIFQIPLCKDHYQDYRSLHPATERTEENHEQ